MQDVEDVRKKQGLSKIRIDENAFVDNGAGEGVQMKLWKRGFLGSTTIDSGKDVAIKLRKDALREARVEAYMKREFTPEQRRHAEALGHAMPGGGYPINDMKDLKDAIQAIGRAKNPKKTKAHIVRRARELGATRHLPDKWIRKSFEEAVDEIAYLLKSEGGEDFNTELAEMRSLDYGEGLMEAVHDASHAMKHSIESIMEDPGTPDKGAAIRGSFGQFLDHVRDLAPEGDVAKIAERAKESLMAKVFKAYTSVGQNDTTNRRAEIADKGKIVEVDDDQEDPRADSPPAGRNATDRAARKAKKWQKRFEELLKMSEKDKESKDYLDNSDNDMDDDVKKQFIDMDKAQRRAYMDANPIDQRAMEKKLAALPSEVRKQLEMGRDAAEKLAKREENEGLAHFTKRAVEARLPKELGPVMYEVHKASPDKFAEVMKAVDVMSKSVKALEETGFIFKEYGTRHSSVDTLGATAYELLMQKAQDAVDQGKFPTPEQAFAKFYDSRDPEIRELMKKGKAEGSL